MQDISIENDATKQADENPVQIQPIKILFVVLLSASIASLLLFFLIIASHWNNPTYQQFIVYCQGSLISMIVGPIVAGPGLLLGAYPLVCYLEHKKYRNILVWLISITLVAALYYSIINMLLFDLRFHWRGLNLFTGAGFMTSFICWYLMGKIKKPS